MTVLWEGRGRTMENEPQSIYELFLIHIHFKEFIFPKIKKLQPCLIKNSASKHIKKKSCNCTEIARKATSKLGAASHCPLLISGTRIISLHAVPALCSRNLSLSFRASRKLMPIPQINLSWFPKPSFLHNYFFYSVVFSP